MDAFPTPRVHQRKLGLYVGAHVLWGAELECAIGVGGSTENGRWQQLEGQVGVVAPVGGASHLG